MMALWVAAAGAGDWAREFTPLIRDRASTGCDDADAYGFIIHSSIYTAAFWSPQMKMAHDQGCLYRDLTLARTGET